MVKITIKRIIITLMVLIVISLIACGEVEVTKDTTPPTISSTSPANSATDVAVNTSIYVTFSEAITTSTITTGTFTVSSGESSISGTITYSGTTVTFTPSSNLNYNTAYTVTISAEVKDESGNDMTSNYSWSFTTEAAPSNTSDTNPPTVISTYPANNAANIAVNASITATFNEAIKPSTINEVTFTLAASGINISGTITYSDTTATFTPSENLSYNTTYTATITTGVKDSAENAMTSNYSWSFTTLPLTPPLPPE